MRISVLIPSWRRPDDLARCLDALEAQSRPPQEVLVVVREGDEPTRKALEDAHPETFAVRAVHVGVPGAVAALRAGLSEASGEVIAVTDDDAAPRRDWLEGIEAHYRLDASVGAVGGPDRLRDRCEPTYDPATVVGKVRWFGRVMGNHHLGAGAARPVDVLKGVNLSVRRAALEDEWLDDRLRGEGAQVHWELALCLALGRAGWKLVYDPAVVVDHYPAPRFGEDQRVQRSLRALADEVHNETYALLRWRPTWRGPAALGYAVIVGTRRAPGLITFLEGMAREPDRRALCMRLLASLRARLAGLKTFLAAR